MCLSADVAFFAESLARYHKQNRMAEAIILKRPIGTLLVDAVNMKNAIIPSPLRCLDVSRLSTIKTIFTIIVDRYDLIDMFISGFSSP